MTALITKAMATTAAIAMIVASSPAAADDTTTGVLAGLGLSAASGKTTLAEGSGSIEAGVLGADAYRQSGAIIAALANATIPADARVLVLAHDESIDLSLPETVRKRIAATTSLYTGITCSQSAKTPGGGKKAARAITPLAAAKDIIGAVATDTAISPITLTASDRVLINAILINQRSRDGFPTAWEMTRSGTNIPDVSRGDLPQLHYVIPSELSLPAISSSSVYRDYANLIRLEEGNRAKCDSDAMKAAMSATDALISSLNTPPEKGGPSPLIAAIQTEQIIGEQPATLRVLRVAIEQVGGTAITRSGVLYTLGFPGAAMVSSGMVVTFRISDPATGAIVTAGVVRCALPPSNLRQAHALVARPRPEAMACSFVRTA